ncbi:MAG: hypothetical protein ACKOBW_02275 [Planctomycetota bacterium]
MFIDIAREHVCLIIRLIEQRLDDLRAELRRTQNYEFKDELRAEFDELTALVHTLRQYECDVSA